MIGKIVKFLSAFVLMTFLFAFCWVTFVADHVYNCTDSAPAIFDYFRPGDWVHQWQPIQFVTEVHTGRSMSEPDVIKTGWSVLALWCLWLTMIATSLTIGLLAARSPNFEKILSLSKRPAGARH